MYLEISNETLLTDIANTEKELEAYQKISDGFRILASLPENAGAEAILLNFKADGHRNSAQRCAEFLNKLHKIKASRGL